ncbi:MAG: glycosyltransferase [Pseudonocardia sp.]
MKDISSDACGTSGSATTTRAADDASPDPGDGCRPIAIFTWGLSYGAFANLCPALAGGIAAAGGGPVDLLYLSVGPGETVAVPPGVRLVRLGVRRAATAPIALIRYLRRERPRALVTMPTFVTLPALLAHRLAGRKVRRDTRFVMHQGETMSNDVDIDHAWNSRLQVMPFLAKRWFPWADALTASAPGVLDLLRHDGVPVPHGRAAVIANPVDVDARRRAADDPPSHPWISGKTGPVVTTLGRLVKRKNHPLLLHAIADIRRTGVDARLVIFGQGPELKACKAEAARLGLSEVVAFAGFVPNPFADIARSDLFVMSSVDEAFCLALVEAMACGVPVVSTDSVGGGPRFVLTGDGGPASPVGSDAEVLGAALVPLDDGTALAATMRRVLTDPAFQAALAGAARRRADDFSPTAVGRQWSTFVDSLA